MNHIYKPASTSTEDTHQELEIFRILKPYIAQCLTLNHDLNNQLSGIIGYAEFLLQEPDGISEEQCGYLNQILNCAQRINQRVNTLSVDKIALGDKVDLKKIIESYKKFAPLSD